MKQIGVLFIIIGLVLLGHLYLSTNQDYNTRQFSRRVYDINQTGSSINQTIGKPSKIYNGSYALIIGASQYNDQSWNDLPSIPNETTSVKTALESHGFNVELALNPNIDTLKEKLNNFVNEYGTTKESEDNRLLIFFAGHGHSREVDDEQKGYIVATDAPDPYKNEKGFLACAYAMTDIQALCKKIEAKHVLFVFDSCFSGSVFNSRSSTPNVPRDIIEAISNPVRECITAGKAEETVPPKSTFVPVFVEGLTGAADTDNDGYIYGSELGLYIRKRIVNDFNIGQTPQYGKLIDSVYHKGDFVFTILEKNQETHPIQVTPFGNLPKGDYTIEGLGIKMVKIIPGTFTMGNPNSSLSGSDIQHKVTLGDEYWIGQYEVTQAQWERLKGKNPSKFQNAGSDAPVESVSWWDVKEFISILNEREIAAGRLPKGYSYALPSEAQWEYACRAGTDSNWDIYSGENFEILGQYNAPALDDISWYGGNSGVSYSGAEDSSSWYQKQFKHNQAGTHIVGKKEPNDFGLYDMIGNVNEWCEDWYGAYPSESFTNPKGPAKGEYRVNRGGSWHSLPQHCLSASRTSSAPDTRSSYIGFRICLKPKQNLSVNKHFSLDQIGTNIPRSDWRFGGLKKDWRLWVSVFMALVGIFMLATNRNEVSPR